MARRKISTTVYITPEQDAMLKELHVRTRVPMAEYIRQGIDLVLQKYIEDSKEKLGDLPEIPRDTH